MGQPSESGLVDVGAGVHWFVRAQPARSETAPTIVALHGFAGSGPDFSLLFSEIDAHWVCPDVLGHGESDAPEGADAYSMPRVSSQLARLLASHVRGPYLLMGYSMGARLALSSLVGELEQDTPRPCPQGLILIGGRPGLADPTDRAARRAADELLADQIESNGMEWFGDYWADLPILATQRNIAPSHRAQMSVRRRAQRACGLAGSLRGMGAGAMPSLWDVLPQLEVPTTLVTGDLDPKFSQIADEMAARMPRAEVVQLSGGGHTAHLERPSRFARLVGSILRR